MRARDASIAALVCAVIWAFCSVLPTGLTTCIGLPFAIAGFSLALWALNKNRRAPEGGVGWLAGGALAFAGLGCAWQVVVLTIAGTVLGGLLVTAFQALQATPTP
jgi:hypothetical protein